MHILLIGKTGQLGWELRQTLACLGQVTALDYPEIDLAKPGDLPPLIRSIQPDLLINAAAYTAVDQAESESELAQAINGTAPGILAETARSMGIALVHYSTDYVFDGQKNSPYNETDEPNPLGVYGSSKLAGELAITQTAKAYLILRTSWVYSTRRDSFVTKVLSWARKNARLRIVSDQVSNPTWARVLAEITAQTLSMVCSQTSSTASLKDWLAERRGIYHVAGGGYSSRLEWARAILRLDPHPEEQVVEEITSALTSDFPSPAQRPLFSALDCTRFANTFGLSLPPWEDALAMALESIS